jgi:hypothetical protein
VNATLAPAHSRLADPRPVLRRIRELLDRRPDFVPRYEAAKSVVRVFRKPAFYEITQRCNLLCEGCYYFEGGLHTPVAEEKAARVWEEFFAAEAGRRISMAYFVGAEPALEQERLVTAARYFPYGNIGTNGTIRIDPVVPFRIGVSVWAGDDDTDMRMRGGSAFRKAFRNYRGDPRAIVLYTLSRWNVSSVRIVAEMCRDNGLPLTFNMYSPTATFLSRLRRGDANDTRFFRESRPSDTPAFAKEDLARVRDTVRGLMEEFPDTVIYSRAYNDWATKEAPLYEIDPATGIAPHCGSRIIGGFSYFGSDLKPMDVKCCTPDVVCSQCRMYSGGWSSKFQPTERDVAGEAAFSSWLEMIRVHARAARHSRP